MKKNIKKQIISLIIVLILVLIIISSFIFYNQWPLMTGKKIILDTEPLDPFDPFRGQYMTINYEISNIEDIDGFKEKDTIYVLLNEDEKGIWRYDSSSRTKPKQGDFIKGKVIIVRDNSIRIEYGIEQFFFERHAELPTTNITVEVSVASSGRARLYQMLYNGEPIEIKYKDFDIKA